MNSLSWFVYLIHVVDSIREFLYFLIFLPIPALLIWLIGSMIALEEHKPKTWDSWKVWALRWGVAAIVCFIVLAIVPSRQTMLLIAGSEIGQRVAQSEGVRSITDPGTELLRTWINTETSRLLEQAAGKKK